MDKSFIYGCFQEPVNQYAVELALLILNLSRAEYNSISEEEIKNKYQTCDKKEEILARKILISDKQKQILFWHNQVQSGPPQYRSFR